MILQEFWSKSWGPDMCIVTVTDSEANSKTESLPSFISEREGQEYHVCPGSLLGSTVSNLKHKTPRKCKASLLF